MPLIIPCNFSGDRRGIRNIEAKRIPVDLSWCHRSERQRKHGYLFFGQLCSAKLTDVDIRIVIVVITNQIIIYIIIVVVNKNSMYRCVNN